MDQSIAYSRLDFARRLVYTYAWTAYAMIPETSVKYFQPGIQHKPEVFRRAIDLLLDGQTRAEILRILKREFGDDAPTSFDTINHWNERGITPAQREEANAMQHAIAHNWATRTLDWSNNVDTSDWSPVQMMTVYGIATDKAHNIDRIEVSRQRNVTEAQKLSLFEELLRSNTRLLKDRFVDAIDAEVLPLPALESAP